MLRLPTHHLLNINSSASFNEQALLVFNHQVIHNPVYRKYVHTLGINVHTVTTIQQIPFLPITFFKTHKVVIGNEYIQKSPAVFLSSATTGILQSKHFVNDVGIYEWSYLTTFRHFYGNIEEYCILALLPSYLEREGSSLIYMVNDLILKSKHPDSGFYLHNHEELLSKLKQLEAVGQKTILLGVSYALLDLADEIKKNHSDEKVKLKNTIIMETGGMKGKRREMLKEELHALLCKGFGVETIHSEYGMTELLSQAYSKENGLFYCPPWMKVMIRDVNDPFEMVESGRTGGINIIDLANVHSCSFIATQDLGRSNADTGFEVLGRFDNTDLRGCNLLVQ